MTGTSFIFPDAIAAQTDILASLWTPEGVAPLLTIEAVLGVNAASSIINHAAPTVNGTVMGAPVFNPHSMTVANDGTNAGINTGKAMTDSDMTFVAVLKTPTNTGGIIGSGNFLGILYGVANPTFGFYNTSGGVAPTVPEVSPVTSTNFQFVIGWGSAGGAGHIRIGSANSLSAIVTGSGNGVARTGEVAKIAGWQGNLSAEIAYCAYLGAILTDAQQLAWYQTLRGDGTAAGSPLGVIVA